MSPYDDANRMARRWEAYRFCHFPSSYSLHSPSVFHSNAIHLCWFAFFLSISFGDYHINSRNTFSRQPWSIWSDCKLTVILESKGKTFFSVVVHTVFEQVRMKFCNARLAARSSPFSLGSSSLSSNSCSDSDTSESQSGKEGEWCNCVECFGEDFSGWMVISSVVVGSSSSSMDDILQRRTSRRFIAIIVCP